MFIKNPAKKFYKKFVLRERWWWEKKSTFRGRLMLRKSLKSSYLEGPWCLDTIYDRFTCREPMMLRKITFIEISHLKGLWRPERFPSKSMFRGRMIVKKYALKWNIWRKDVTPKNIKNISTLNCQLSSQLKRLQNLRLGTD